MYLKTIELHGFKSFAGKMLFSFEEGITAIVGPNGSGKSNIADAVRWVLGEQSAKLLRGSKMQDVIFAGTEERKPVSFCQVDLTINNDDKMLDIDYEEVVVSRRVYRSNESEYYINGSACRMRDIQELFMDTGIGREGYSIIGQGQIDKILSEKPSERRSLFDEAAGIVKYKKRKSNALKKLEEERQNLLRINDIVSELEVNIKSLEVKSKKARAYLDLKEQLKVRDIVQFIDELETINTGIKEKNALFEMVKKDIVELNKSIVKNETDNEQINTKIKDNKSEMARVTAEINRETEKKAELKQSRSLSLQSIEHLKELIAKYENDALLMTQKIEVSKTSLEKYKKDVEHIFNQSKISEEKIQDKEAKLRIIVDEYNSLEKSISDMQTTIVEDLNKMASMKSSSQHFETVSKSNDDRSKSIKNRRIILEESIKEIKSTIDALKSDKKSVEKDIKELRINHDKTNEDRRAFLSKFTALRDELELLRSNISVMTTKMNALNDVIYSYEGFNFSIKRVMSLKKTYKEKIVGVVTDILKVDKEYERAIEIAIAGNYQNIIVSHSSVAKELISYLKSNRYGRATFLPLDKIKYSSTRKNYSNIDGVFGYGDELVSYDEKYDNIVKYLLGKTLIVKDLDTALTIKKQYKLFIRLVTLEGDVINAGGAMTGGEYKNKTNNMLSRQRESEKLKKEIKEANEVFEKKSAKAKELKEKISSIDLSINKFSEQLSVLNARENELSIQLHKLDVEYMSGSDELTGISLQLEQIAETNASNKEQHDVIAGEIKEKELEIEEIKTKIEQFREELKKKTDEREKLTTSINEVKINSTRLFEQKTNSELNIKNMTLDIEELSDNLVSIEKSKKDNLTLIDKKQEEITICDNNIVGAQERIEKLQTEKEILLKDELRLSEIYEKSYKDKEKLQKQVSDLEKKNIIIENELAKQTEKRDASYDYMWDTYDLTYTECEKIYKESSIDKKNIKSEINKLKKQIKELGDVDVNSIEEYVSVSERYKFLSEQKEDLEKSEVKLKDVIKELDVMMKEQFESSFKQINQEFGKVFKSLFGGGRAHLALTDAEDLLEAGIDINVQPPGKKLQSMMLLSGGERAFSAIALLFAILNLKPTPFCVLDEIEAALDDTNVVKFASYLKKIAKKMQFIVITHRRGTMEYADTLYGITMQEKGISKQVSVKLIDSILK